MKKLAEWPSKFFRAASARPRRFALPAHHVTMFAARSSRHPAPMPSALLADRPQHALLLSLHFRPRAVATETCRPSRRRHARVHTCRQQVGRDYAAGCRSRARSSATGVSSRRAVFFVAFRDVSVISSIAATALAAALAATTFATSLADAHAATSLAALALTALALVALALAALAAALAATTFAASLSAAFPAAALAAATFAISVAATTALAPALAVTFAAAAFATTARTAATYDPADEHCSQRPAAGRTSRAVVCR